MKVYRFGQFELDLDAFELKLPGKSVRLERRALDLLALLVKQPNRLVPREEIIAALWPPNVVIDFDSGLNTLVRKVRAALGDSSDSPQYIETVAGRGYRFVAPVVTLSERPPPPDASTAAPPAPRLNRRRWMFVAIGVACLALAALATWIIGDSPRGPQRIAVLPFENLTGDDDLAYLASGLAEETSYALARLEGGDVRVVNVPPSASAGVPASIRELGGKLGVNLVLQGSMRVDGDHARVTARLIRATDGEELWSASIDRALTNVIGVQRELSTAIAEQIRMRLAPEVAAAIEKRQTQNPQAYALYLKGRHEWEKLTPPGARRAIEYYEQATRLDPDYALAWAGLAWGSITSIRTADASPLVATPQAKRALDEALRLGPDLAETQIALGYYRIFHELNPKEGAKAGRRAVELDPNSAYAYQLLGVSLMSESKVEAAEMMRRAREIAPMFTLAFANSANVALSAEDLKGATEFARQAIAIDPDFWLGHYYLGRCLFLAGDKIAALREYEDAARLSDGHSITYQPRVRILLAEGRTEEAQAVVKTARDLARTSPYFSPFTLAQLDVLVGNVDSAFAELERAIDVRDVNLLGLNGDSSLAPIRKDPRFAKLVERCNCSPYSTFGR